MLTNHWLLKTCFDEICRPSHLIYLVTLILLLVKIMHLRLISLVTLIPKNHINKFDGLDNVTGILLLVFVNQSPWKQYFSNSILLDSIHAPVNFHTSSFWLLSELSLALSIPSI